jgi:Tfp pilus assembly protein PilF
MEKKKMTLGQLEEAKETYKQALEIMKTSFHTPDTLARYYMTYGRLPRND